MGVRRYEKRPGGCTGALDVFTSKRGSAVAAILEAQLDEGWRVIAKAHDLELVVTERPRSITHVDRFYAKFRNVEIMESGTLRSTFGNGNTPEEAIADYWPRISGQKIAGDAHKDSRSEIQVPILEAV